MELASRNMQELWQASAAAVWKVVADARQPANLHLVRNVGVTWSCRQV